MASDYLILTYPEGVLSDDDFTCVNSGTPDSKWFYAPNLICPECDYTIVFQDDERRWLDNARGGRCPGCRVNYQREERVICAEREANPDITCSHWKKVFGCPSICLARPYSSDPEMPVVQEIFEYLGESHPFITNEMIAYFSQKSLIYTPKVLRFLSEHRGEHIFSSVF